MLEGEFKTRLTKKIERRFGDDVFVVRFDSAFKQGIPDMGLLFRHGFWAALEAKTSASARRQPNQPYYVELMGRLCYAAFIYPENEEAVLNDVETQYDQYCRQARFLES